MASLAESAIWPVLAASDIGRAKEWYRDKLGLSPAKEEGGLWYAFGEGTWLLVYPTPHAGTAQNTQAHLDVAGIESLMDDLRSRDVVFEEYDFGEMGRTVNGVLEAEGWKAAWFKDSEGNTIEITERA